LEINLALVLYTLARSTRIVPAPGIPNEHGSVAHEIEPNHAAREFGGG
jgi:hypothetical protein